MAKELKPVKPVVAAKQLAPAKSVVTRTPEERLALVDKQIEEMTARMRKLKFLGSFGVLSGLLIAVSVAVITWLFTDYIVLWGLPVFLLGGTLGAYCAIQSGKLGGQLSALNLERRGYVKEAKHQPYGHGKVEAP